MLYHGTDAQVFRAFSILVDTSALSEQRVLQAKFPQSPAMKPNPSCTASASDGQSQAGYGGDKSAEQNWDTAALE